jgi:hypothetical protein
MHFGARVLVLLTRTLESRRHFVDATVLSAENVGDREQFAFIGPRAGNRTTVGNSVEQRA